MSNPLSYPNLLITVAKMQKDIRDLQRRRLRSGATDLDGLDDGEVKYLHPTDAPQLDQAWRWDDTADLPQFGGIARFADPTVVADYFTVPITGDGTFGLPGGAFLVDSDWDVDRPCHVEVSVVFNGSYSLQAVSPATDPVSYHQAPTVIAQLIDGDGGAVSTPGADYEGVREDWEIVTPSGLAVKQKHLSWTYTRGRPKLWLVCTVSADAEPGLSGSPELLVITRCTRL